MCRLYGFRATEETKVECSLVHAQNALMLQSGRDRIGRKHPDGWGIAYFQGGLPMVERRASAAYDCIHFSGTAERVYSKTVLAHVRLATVGQLDPRNCHPFSWQQWVFAHNGTVTGIDRLRPQLQREIPDQLRLNIQGDTDSELMFYWLLTHLLREGLINGQSCVDLVAARELIAHLLLQLDERCHFAEPSKKAKLNIILTNGVVLIATRFGNDLHWLQREGIHDCEICGIPHVRSPTASISANFPYRAVIVASEPISHEVWREVPDKSIITLDARLEVSLLSLGGKSVDGNESRVCH
jgi:predicted glutamine amidotransferase